MLGTALGCPDGTALGCAEGCDEGCDVGAAVGTGSPQLNTKLSVLPELICGEIEPVVLPPATEKS